MRHLGIPADSGLLALPVRRDNLQVTVHMVDEGGEELRRKMIVDLVKNPQIVDVHALAAAEAAEAAEYTVAKLHRNGTENVGGGGGMDCDSDGDASPDVVATVGVKRKARELTVSQQARLDRLAAAAASNAISLVKASGRGSSSKQQQQQGQQLTIVYVWRRFEADSLGEYLKGAGVSGVAVYHAGIDAGTRERTQRMFDRGAVRCIVATVAFGMGVDKADVRQVIHCTMPKSIESYMQVRVAADEICLN